MKSVRKFFVSRARLVSSSVPFLAALTLLAFSCAPRFILRPTGDLIVSRDSQDFSYAQNADCRVEATYLDEKLDSSMIQVRVYSKSKRPIALSHEQFRLEGDPFPTHRTGAADPAPHRKKLETEIALIEKRLATPIWDGVSEIHEYMLTEKKDETIERSKDEYANNQKERDRMAKRVTLLRKELTFLADRGFTSGTVPALGELDALLIFPTAYVKEGDAAFIVDAAGCRTQLSFAARISKSSIF